MFCEDVSDEESQPMIIDISLGHSVVDHGRATDLRRRERGYIDQSEAAG